MRKVETQIREGWPPQQLWETLGRATSALTGGWDRGTSKDAASCLFLLARVIHAVANSLKDVFREASLPSPKSIRLGSGADSRSSLSFRPMPRGGAFSIWVANRAQQWLTPPTTTNPYHPALVTPKWKSSSEQSFNYTPG